MFSVLPGVCIWVAAPLRFVRTEQHREESGLTVGRGADCVALLAACPWPTDDEVLGHVIARI